MNPVYIKCRKIGSKRFAFLTPRGGLNHLRIHASQFESQDKAQSLIDENKADNPEWEWLIVSVYGKAGCL